MLVFVPCSSSPASTPRSLWRTKPHRPASSCCSSYWFRRRRPGRRRILDRSGAKRASSSAASAASGSTSGRARDQLKFGSQQYDIIVPGRYGAHARPAAPMPSTGVPPLVREATGITQTSGTMPRASAWPPRHDPGVAVPLPVTNSLVKMGLSMHGVAEASSISQSQGALAVCNIPRFIRLDFAYSTARSSTPWRASWRGAVVAFLGLERGFRKNPAIRRPTVESAALTRRSP